MHAALVGQMAGLAVVFGVSAFGKARHPRATRAFATSLRGWRVVPDRLVATVAVAVIGLEIAVVAGAIASLATTATGEAWRPVAVATLVVAAFLLTALTVGIALALRHGPGAACACFGTTERPLNAGHLVRDVVLLLTSVGGIVLATGADNRPTGLAGAIVAVAAGAVAGWLVVRLDDLIDLFASGPASGPT
jgi:hypothetical protein